MKFSLVRITTIAAHYREADLVKEKKLVILNQGKALKIEMALAWYPRADLPAYFRELIQAIK